MSDDVRLRDVVATDLEVFFEQGRDPEAVRRSAFTPRERDAFMAHWSTNILGDPTVLVQAVTVDGELAGNIMAWWERDLRNLGYWFGREYWGRGIGTRALRLFLQAEANRPIYAEPVTGNIGSVRLLEKLGFQRVDTVREGPNEYVVFQLSAE